jgi:hypothetical protein
MLLLATVARGALPAGYGVAHALSVAGAVLGGLAVVARRARAARAVRLRGVAGTAWLVAILASTIGSTVAVPSPIGFGTGLGVALLIGLLASLGIAWLAYAVRPAWFGQPRAATSRIVEADKRAHCPSASTPPAPRVCSLTLALDRDGPRSL